MLTESLPRGFMYERVGMHIVRQSYTFEKELRAGKELSTQFVDL